MFLFLLFCFFFVSMLTVPQHSHSVKVINLQALSVRETIDSENCRSFGRSYQISCIQFLETYVSHYKIQLQITHGWIYTNPKKAWVTSNQNDNSKVILLKSLKCQTISDLSSKKLGSCALERYLMVNRARL